MVPDNRNLPETALNWRSAEYELRVLDKLVSARLLVFPADRSYNSERWHWQYSKNPHQPYWIDLAVDKNDPEKIAGHYALLPFRLKTPKGLIAAAQSLDTFTHPDYRKQGIFVGLARITFERAKQGGVELVYGFPNHQSYPGFVKSLDFKDPFGLHHYQLPLRTGFFLRRVPGLPRLRPLEGVRLKWPKPPRAYSLSENAVIPSADWDSFFEEGLKPFRFCVERNARYIQWRYADCPDRRYSILTLTKDGRLEGFSVCRILEDTGKGKTGHWVDFLARDDEGWRALFQHSLAWFLEHEAESIVTFLHPENPVASRFVGAGFIKRSAEHRFIVKQLHPNQTEAELHRPENWFLTPGDTDFF